MKSAVRLQTASLKQEKIQTSVTVKHIIQSSEMTENAFEQTGETREACLFRYKYTGQWVGYTCVNSLVTFEIGRQMTNNLLCWQDGQLKELNCVSSGSTVVLHRCEDKIKELIELSPVQHGGYGELDAANLERSRMLGERAARKAPLLEEIGFWEATEDCPE